MGKIYLLLLSASLFLACKGSNSEDETTRRKAREFAGAGKYKVLQTSNQESKRYYYSFTCNCDDKLWLILQRVSGGKDDKPNLCLSGSHEQLLEFAKLNEDEMISFEYSDKPVQNDCQSNEATYLKLKK
jgi:hypothetical protein